jgi:hypothetical protein
MKIRVDPTCVVVRLPSAADLAWLAPLLGHWDARLKRIDPSTGACKALACFAFPERRPDLEQSLQLIVDAGGQIEDYHDGPKRGTKEVALTPKRPFKRLHRRSRG